MHRIASSIKVLTKNEIELRRMGRRNLLYFTPEVNFCCGVCTVEENLKVQARLYGSGLVCWSLLLEVMCSVPELGRGGGTTVSEAQA